MLKTMENIRAEILLTADICTAKLAFYHLSDIRDPRAGREGGGGPIQRSNRLSTLHSTFRSVEIYLGIKFSFQSEILKIGSVQLSTSCSSTSTASTFQQESVPPPVLQICWLYIFSDTRRHHLGYIQSPQLKSIQHDKRKLVQTCDSLKIAYLRSCIHFLRIIYK